MTAATIARQILAGIRGARGVHGVTVPDNLAEDLLLQLAARPGLAVLHAPATPGYEVVIVGRLTEKGAAA